MSSLQPGQMLGPYQIISQIGKGGMATVYKAYHAAMDRYVALKVVATQLITEDPNFLQRFRQEARLIAKLEHPNILPVHDFGEDNGIPYMVMRFLEAGTLKERISTETLSLGEIDRIFTQLADALQYAHDNGVIHRDIKPSNAMLDRRGDVFLTDFGVAKMMEGTVQLTATGAITGTPAYMSPEQAQGLKIDPRSDIYSLGVVLFEMLTGRVPFEAETPMAVIFKHIQDPPPPLSIVRPDLPYTLEAILLKALAKDPADRFASMVAFRAGWKSALAEASSLAAGMEQTSRSLPPRTPAAAPAPTVKKPFPRRILFVGGMLVALVAVLFLGYLVLRQQAGPAAPGTSATPGKSGTLATPAISGTPAAPGTPGTQSVSWTGANTYYSLAIQGSQIYAAGPGGLSIFNSNDSLDRQITTADGLPSSFAEYVFIDTDGSLWIATSNGILHQNGSQRDVYTTQNGLDSDSVISLARVSQERLWAATHYSGADGGGLMEYTGKGWKAVAGFPSSMTESPETVSNSVNRILPDSNGNIWVSTDYGIAMLDSGGKWNVFTGLPDNAMFVLFEDKGGKIWAGSRNGFVATFNPEKRGFDLFADLNQYGMYGVAGILQDDKNQYWFAGNNVARYTAGEERWEIFQREDGSLPVSSITAMARDGQGRLYFGTEGQGLVRYENEKFSVIYRENRPTYAYYRDILPAPDGRLLFTELYDAGVDQFNPADETWARLSPDFMSPLAYDAKGRLWSGGFEGAWIFDAQKTTHLTKTHGLPSDAVRAVAFVKDGTAYIVTDAGIAVFDGQKVTEVFTSKSAGLASNDIYAIYAASDGSVWVATSDRFSRRLPDGKWEHFNPGDLFGGQANAIMAFAEDKSGSMWVSTQGDGLYQFKGGKWTRFLSTDPGVGLPSDNLTSLFVAPDGALWIGTFEAGAVRFDGQTWQIFNTSQGLIHATVYDIYVDKNNAIWFATQGGITRLGK